MTFKIDDMKVSLDLTNSSLNDCLSEVELYKVHVQTNFLYIMKMNYYNYFVNVFFLNWFDFLAKNCISM